MKCHSYEYAMPIICKRTSVHILLQQYLAPNITVWKKISLYMYVESHVLCDMNVCVCRMWRQQDWSLFVEQDYLQMMSKFGCTLHPTTAMHSMRTIYIVLSVVSPNSAIYTYTHPPQRRLRGWLLIGICSGSVAWGVNIEIAINQFPACTCSMHVQYFPWSQPCTRTMN